MNFEIKQLPAGLYFVATPIGNARDITLRALDILASADVLAAEDTRSLRHLMEIHGIPLAGRHIIAYHDHNGASARPRLLGLMAQGKSLAYASEAGTPLVADPGFVLGRDAIAADIPVTSAPGPSAVIAALSISGLPTDRFLFAGFPPSTAGARRRMFDELAPLRATLAFYESPKRVNRTLTELADTFGANRPAVICRELTKRFEEVRRGTLASLAEDLAGVALKGEVVMLVGYAEAAAPQEEDVEAALAAALTSSSVKDAAAEVAAKYGLKKRDVYQMALARAEKD